MVQQITSIAACLQPDFLNQMHLQYIRTPHPEGKMIIELHEEQGLDDESINASLAEYTDDDKIIRYLTYFHPLTGQLSCSEGFSFSGFLDYEFKKRIDKAYTDIQSTISTKDSLELVRRYFVSLETGLNNINRELDRIEWNERYPFVRQHILNLIIAVQKLKKEYLGRAGKITIKSEVGINIESVLGNSGEDNVEASVSQLVEELFELGLMRNTSINHQILVDFFTGRQTKHQLDWLGTIYDLHVFINGIWDLEPYVKEVLPKNKWQRAVQFFTHNGKIIKTSQLTRPGPAPKYNKAKKIVGIIKAMLPASTSK